MTPSSSRPSHSPLSPRHDDESCYVSDEVHRPGASSALTIQPFRCKGPAGLTDHGDSKRYEIRHSQHVKLTHTVVYLNYLWNRCHPIIDRPTPFEKTEDSLPSWWGRSNTRTRIEQQPTVTSDGGDYVADANRHASSCEKPPNRPTHSLRPPTPGRSRALRHLPFPNLSIRDTGDASVTKSRFCHATSPSGSPNTALSRSKSQRGKYKLGPHRFLVGQKVGEGGFGQVYKAIEIHTGHTVAIKTVSRKGLNRSRVDATLKEQKVAQRIARHQRQAIGNRGDFVVRMLASFLTPNHFVFILVSIELDYVTFR